MVFLSKRYSLVYPAYISIPFFHLSPCLLHFQLYRPPYCSSSMSNMLILQGFCTCCSLCLEGSTCKYPHGWLSHIYSDLCLKITSTERPFFTRHIQLHCYYSPSPDTFICPSFWYLSYYFLTFSPTWHTGKKWYYLNSMLRKMEEVTCVWHQ